MHSKRPFPRHVRVAAQLQREIADWLIQNADAPYNTSVTITRVAVQKNFGGATVYVLPQITDDPEEIDPMLDYLNSTCHELQHHLGKSLRIKRVPRLTFAFDKQYDHAANMEKLFMTLDQDSDTSENEHSDV